MKKIYIFFFIVFAVFFLSSQEIDLSKEYSLDEFQDGVRAFHNGEYELAITYFIKSLGYNEDNHLARFFLGESFRKAGYEKNAIFSWNNLLSLGYQDNVLKKKLSYLYNKRGMLTNININKDFLLREDIKGILPEESLSVFIRPSQIFVDNKNHYYLASFLTGRIVEFDSNLRIVRNHFSVIKNLQKPFGVVVDNEGFLYVSDFAADTVFRLNQAGIIENSIGYKGVGDGGLLGPEYLLLDDEENLYVVDSGNHRINKYKKNGDFLFSFGNKDIDEIQLVKPAGLYYYDNKIYVCDREANRILIYDKHGNYISSFGENRLKTPYDLTRDRFGRFLIVCEKNIWAYEVDNALWYVIDAIGTRLKKGISIETDKNNNILVSDFSTSRFFVLSSERARYTNLNVNVERVFSEKFPDVHMAVTIENDDFSVPVGITPSNITVYENGKLVGLVGDYYTEVRDKNTDIMVVFDCNKNMMRYKEDFKKTMNDWMQGISTDTNVAFVTVDGEDAILSNEFGASRLSIIDSINNNSGVRFTDKGSAIKFGIYHMIRRFSKKAVVFVTDSSETGNDFDKFKLENCVALARNNNIPLYIVSFSDGPFSEMYKYIARKTDGDYYRVYKRNDLHNLFKRIEESKGREIIFSYSSRAKSRFGEDPVSVTIEVEYAGMNGTGKTVYYPMRSMPFYK